MPIVEVHLSNIDEREEWRRALGVADVVAHRVIGKGPDGLPRGARLPRRLDGERRDAASTRCARGSSEPLLVTNLRQHPLPDRLRQLERRRCSSTRPARRSSSPTSATSRTAEAVAGRRGRARRSGRCCATWPSGSSGRIALRGGRRCRTRRSRCSARAGSSSCRRPASSRRSARSRTRPRSSRSAAPRCAADRAFEALTAETWVGRSERELAWRLRQLLHAHGVDELALRHGDRRRARTARSRTREPSDHARRDADARHRRLGRPARRLLLRLHAHARDRRAAAGAARDLRRLPRGAARRGRRGSGPGMTGVEADAHRPRRDRGGRLRRQLRPRPRPRRRRARSTRRRASRPSRPTRSRSAT